MTRRPAPTTRRGFTLLDLMVTLTVVAIVAAVVVPGMRDQRHLRLIAGARLLAADIEAAQVMTIARPDDPVVVRFEGGGGRYWLARLSDPETPIPKPGSNEGYFMQFGEGRGRNAAGVTMTLTDVPDDTLEFNGQGGIADMTLEPKVRLQLDSRWIELAISPTTGTITESSGSD